MFQYDPTPPRGSESDADRGSDRNILGMLNHRRYNDQRYNDITAGRSSLLVSASDCGMRGPRFESHRGRLCLSRHPLRYADLGMGCAPTAVSRPTQPCIHRGLQKSSASFDWGKSGNVKSAGWQVTLCDPIWHVSSDSGEAGLHYPVQLLHRVYLLKLHSW